MASKHKRAAIMGTPVHSGNRGVMALGASLLNLCSGAAGGEVFLMLGHDSGQPAPFRIGRRTRLVPVVPCRLSPRSRPRDHLVWILLASFLYRVVPCATLRRELSRLTPWIAALERSDLVGDIRGGDSFSDIYGMRRFLHGFLMAWTVVLVKGTMVQFPQTFGPYNRPIARTLARYLLKRSSIVIARDTTSRQVAQELIGPEREVWLSPDVAFSLETVRPDPIELDPPLPNSTPSGVLGLNVNGLMFNGGYTRKNMFGLKLDYRNWLPRLVETLIMKHTGELWLVPHTFAAHGNVESDPEACYQVRRNLPEVLRARVRIVAKEYDQHEIKGVIGLCDFFIGSRMHACIAALSQGVPCVGVAYSRKFEGVFESVGMQDWVVDGGKVTAEEATHHIMELYQERDLVRGELAVRAEAARTKVIDTFEELFRKQMPST